MGLSLSKSNLDFPDLVVGVKKELSHAIGEVFVLELGVASWGNELR
jgi:hypothetical protein